MKMLSELLPGLELDTDIQITGITDDSRKARRGDLFLAVPGSRVDGRDYVVEVAGKSVAAIVCDPPFKECVVSGVPIFTVDNLAPLRGEIASEFYDRPSAAMTVVAVTGTNGKTSCSQYIAAAMNRLGRLCGIVGTMGSGFESNLQNPGLTTPDAITLQKIIAEFRDESADAVSLEASSHGLDQGRLNGLQVNVAVFTNITRDHLDYHGSFSAYKKAKQKLFELEHLEAAVINLDDSFSTELEMTVCSSVRVLTYSLKNSDASLWCKSLEFNMQGFNARVSTPWGEVPVSSSLLGDFNVSNLLVVIAVLGLKGFGVKEISSAVSSLSNIKGRMDVLYPEDSATVVIDYAHTPDALEKALNAVRLHGQGEVWCLMGCGGNRDKGKRSEMGELVTRLADHAVITDDNPRDEKPMEIIEDILKGVHPGAHAIVKQDRRKAIAYALKHARAGDVVLIAGKGHEEYQEVAGKKLDYSDYDEVAKHTHLSSETASGVKSGNGEN